MSLLDISHLDLTPPKPPLEQLRKEIADKGYSFSPIVDGKIHRFDTPDKPGRKNGWYVFFQSGQLLAGAFGDWKNDNYYKWHSFAGHDQSAEEMEFQKTAIENAMAQRAIEREKLAAESAARAADIIDKARPATHAHPYLSAKCVESYGLQLNDEHALIIPMRDIDDNLRSLQFIKPDGEKKFLYGGTVKGCFYQIGHVGESKRLYITEGYSSGATVFAATGKPTFIAFSAGNIPAVARALRGKYGYIEIVIVADNDESGTGQKYAQEASAAVGASIIMPPQVGQDINDYFLSGNSVLDLLQPVRETWLVQADEFCRKPEPIKWLVKGWLSEGSLLMLHGPSGAGKSFVALDMSLRIAGGLPDWFGYRVKKAPVVYLAGEGHHGIKSRVAAWKQYFNPENELQMWISRSGSKIDHAIEFQKIVEEINKLPMHPALIVVDTLHRFLIGDENSAKDAGTFITACAKLQEHFTSALMIVHHTGVSEGAEGRARGSSAWRGALDNEMNIVPPKKGSDVITIRQMKSKDSDLSPDIYAEKTVVPVDGWIAGDGEQVTSLVLLPGDKPRDGITDNEHNLIMALREISDDGKKERITQKDVDNYVMSVKGKRDKKFLNSCIDMGLLETCSVGVFRITGRCGMIKDNIND